MLIVVKRMWDKLMKMVKVKRMWDKLRKMLIVKLMWGKQIKTLMAKQDVNLLVKRVSISHLGA